MTPASGNGLRVLVVDDERPSLDELAFLLSADERVVDVVSCDSATEGLRVLRTDEVDCVFLDIQMPGLTGLELADVLWFVVAVGFYALAALPAAWAVNAIIDAGHADYVPTLVLVAVVGAVVRVDPFSLRDGRG